MTPSQVSYVVKRAERRIGAPLFERGPPTENARRHMLRLRQPLTGRHGTHS
ncbi:hypothetical protein ACIBF1_19645 [Spirillospora sp. NPDC050679]